MANTYSQINIHLVFAVKYRAAIIHPELEQRLYQMLSAMVNNRGNTTIAIGGMPDHVHLLLGMTPTECVSELVKTLKTATTTWINGERLTPSRFAWQAGYGVFSYSNSQVPAVVRYILGQKEHHRQRTFMEEYRRILSDLNIKYEERYLFSEAE